MEILHHYFIFNHYSLKKTIFKTFSLLINFFFTHKDDLQIKTIWEQSKNE